MSITLDTPVSATDDLLCSNLGGEEVILDPETGTYYGLDDVGTQIWSLLENPRTAREVCDRLEAEYDVERAALEEDVLRLFRKFDDEGLVRQYPRSEAQEAA